MSSISMNGLRGAISESSRRLSNGHSGYLSSAAADPYIMLPSPVKRRHNGSEGYRPTVKKCLDHVPACLVNASVTYCGDNQIYTFGGFDQYTDEVYNHVLRLDLNSQEWTLVDNFGDIPGVRMGHTATLWQGKKLVVFGGENEHREHLSDVYILDLATSTWTSPEIRGPKPKGRGRHAAVIYDDKLFIIGGSVGEADHPLDDICYLDLKTWTWSRSWLFVPRYDHTAWIYNDKLWIFGGMGIEMLRTTDLWWIDLKNFSSICSSSSQGTTNVFYLMDDNVTDGSGIIYGSASPLQLRPGYPANTSGQLRSVGRQKRIAPGSISSVTFHTGTDVPTLSSGTHFHVASSGVLIDIASPSSTLQTENCSLCSLDFDTMRWQKFAEGTEVFKSDYRWHYCTLNDDGTKVWLLGCFLASTGQNGIADDNVLSELMCIDLEEYGFLGRKLALNAPESKRSNGLGGLDSCVTGLGADLISLFNQAPESGSGTDFVITAQMDQDHAYDPDDSVAFSSISSPPGSRQSDKDATTSPPINVHKIILQARWPHFKRLCAAQMAEYHTNTMHIPEPYSVVLAFLYYLYTDSITYHPDYCPTINEVAGMLVMANIYDMPKLRLLCVNRLGRDLAIENAAVIFERASRTNEIWLKRRASAFCLAHWGRVVRTLGFRTLSRQCLMELCEVVDTDGRVMTGPELEMVDCEPYAFTSRGSRRHPHLIGPELADLDDVDPEEEDVMEM
ncbi:hypothetical protein KEM54_004977 [Ascosphaera aggregata]|nr:hypothetical protein KEM54_004977 [Ascosphaera aggregata]